MKPLFLIFIVIGSVVCYGKNLTDLKPVTSKSFLNKNSCQSGDIKIFNIGKIFSKYTTKVLVCREKNKDKNDERPLHAYVLLFHQDSLLKDINLDNYLPEGNNPNIETVFLFKHELIILVSWNQHIKYTADGKLFKPYVYHIKEMNNNVVIDNLPELFSFDFNGTQEGEVVKSAYCTKDGIIKEIKKLSNLSYFSKLVQNNKINASLSNIQELLFYNKITQKTLTPYNNIAYYLQKAGANEEAAYLLEKIITKFPNRTVAYYNLGDAYWARGEKKKAIKAYNTYIEQMCHKRLQKKIPKEVLERVKDKR